MGYDFYLMPLLISFAFASLALVFFILLSKKKIMKDMRQDKRHIHQKGISRFGGAAVIVAFIVAILIDKRLVIGLPLLSIMISSAAILIFGIVDDFQELGWKVQLFFQLAIAVFVFLMGMRVQYITNPFGGAFRLDGYLGHILGFIIVVSWIILLMNAINWIDGVDGAAGGITLIGALAIFFLSLRPEVNQPPLGIISTALMGSLLAFLFLNFNPAKILAGTSGSMFMGFILASLAIFAGAKVATTLLVMAVPAIDAIWVIVERLRAKGSIFSPDRRHLHHRLLEIGWSPKAVSFLYWGVTGLIAVVALNTDAKGKIISFAIISMVVLAFLWEVRSRLMQKNNA